MISRCGRPPPRAPTANGAQGENDESLRNALHPQCGHCRSRRHRENPAGVVVAVHSGDDPPAGKGGRRKHGHRLGRRGDRAQNLDSDRAWPTPNGRPRGSARRQGKNQNQFSGYAGLQHVSERHARDAGRGRRGADRGGRAGGRAGGHGKSVGLRDRVRPAARVRDQLDGPRAGQFRPRPGIGQRVSGAAWCRCICRSARKRLFAAWSI